MKSDLSALDRLPGQMQDLLEQARLRRDRLAGVLVALMEGLGEDALERHAADGLMLTQDDPAWCCLCGATLTNQRGSRDISSPDDWRGTHKPSCAYVQAKAVLAALPAA